VLHIGVAEGRKYFAVEAGSRRGNFDFSQDIENRNFTRAEGDAVWGDAPRRLDTDLDLNATVEKWQSRTKELAWPAILTRSMKNMGVEENGKVDVKVSHGLADFLAEESGENMAAASTDPDKVRWSDDVGTYLCGFIFYAGMVQKSTMVAADSRPSARVGKRDTAFMHVPLLKSEKEIALGVNVTIALVQSLVESWRAQKALE
jgi:pyroglutamyl-peptidase